MNELMLIIPALFFLCFFATLKKRPRRFRYLDRTNGETYPSRRR